MAGADCPRCGCPWPQDCPCEAAPRAARERDLQAVEATLALMERRALNAEGAWRRAKASGDIMASIDAADHRRRLIDLVARLRHEIDCMRGEG